jgi:hypothetical protein
MDVGARSLKVVFEQSRRLVVPVFQLPCVWSREVTFFALSDLTFTPSTRPWLSSVPFPSQKRSV